MEKFKFVASRNARVLKFLEDALPRYQYSDLTKALRKKDILVNGTRIKDNIKINPQDCVEIYLTTNEVKFDIVYEDENIIVFNKPTKIEVCDGSYNLKDEYFKKYNKHIYPIHRLDTNTVGLVLFAKTRDTEKLLIEAFKAHLVTKFYYAVVTGNPDKEKVLKSYLKKDDTSTVKIYNNKVPASVPIETKYTLIKTFKDLNLLSVEITAGKTHQIRAHLSYFNLPIVGDSKYGSNAINKKYKQNYQMLEAYKIEFHFDEKNSLAYLNNLHLEIDCCFDSLFTVQA